MALRRSCCQSIVKMYVPCREWLSPASRCVRERAGHSIFLTLDVFPSTDFRTLVGRYPSARRWPEVWRGYVASSAAKLKRVQLHLTWENLRLVREKKAPCFRMKTTVGGFPPDTSPRPGRGRRERLQMAGFFGSRRCQRDGKKIRLPRLKSQRTPDAERLGSHSPGLRSLQWVATHQLQCDNRD